MNGYNPIYGFQGYQQAQYQPQPRQRLMKCFPVTSIEEARAAMIDVDGSLTVFPDIANGKIYTKAVDLNGMAVLHTYELADNAQAQITADQRISQLEMLVNELKEEIENVKQSSNAVIKSTARKSKSGTNDDAVSE